MSVILTPCTYKSDLFGHICIQKIKFQDENFSVIDARVCSREHSLGMKYLLAERKLFSIPVYGQIHASQVKYKTRRRHRIFNHSYP